MLIALSPLKHMFSHLIAKTLKKIITNESLIDIDHKIVKLEFAFVTSHSLLMTRTDQIKDQIKMMWGQYYEPSENYNFLSFCYLF